MEDEPPPYQPSPQLPSQPQPLLEPLIDLSNDQIPVPTAATTVGDLNSQLAALGLDQPPPAATDVPTTTTVTTNAPDTFDEFDIFAQSRQAYSDTRCDTYIASWICFGLVLII